MTDARALREALEKIVRELGEPQPGYPAPVANAVLIARAALVAAPATEEPRLTKEQVALWLLSTEEGRHMRGEIRTEAAVPFAVPAAEETLQSAQAASQRRYLGAHRRPAAEEPPLARGEPTTAQIDAVRDAWPADFPLPDDPTIRAMVLAANRCPWPDPPFPVVAPLTVEALAEALLTQLLKEFHSWRLDSLPHPTLEAQARWLLSRLPGLGGRG